MWQARKGSGTAVDGAMISSLVQVAVSPYRSAGCGLLGDGLRKGGLSLGYNGCAFLTVKPGAFITVMQIAPSIWRNPMPSFDVVSELDKHEVTNAVDNAIKELDRRYDLRGKGSFEFKELTVTLTAEADFQLEQMLEILKL